MPYHRESCPAASALFRSSRIDDIVQPRAANHHLHQIRMLLRIGRASLWALVGYLGAAFVTYWLVMWLSSNTYDRQMEAGMTAVFVAGPIFAVIAFLVGVFRRD